MLESMEKKVIYRGYLLACLLACLLARRHSILTRCCYMACVHCPFIC